MALWDAKDPRWLVSQRQDGANVNGWHWEEKNLMGWSKAKLDALLAGLPAGLDSALGHAKLAGVKDLTGEAVLTRRKGNKVFAYYDLSLSISWQGRWLETNESVTGTVTIGELAVSNDPDEYLWTFTAEGSGTAQDNLKSAVQGLRAEMEKRLEQFAREIAEIGN